MVSNLRKNFLCIAWHYKPTVLCFEHSGDALQVHTYRKFRKPNFLFSMGVMAMYLVQLQTCVDRKWALKYNGNWNELKNRFTVQVDNYEIVVKSFRISHNLTWYSAIVHKFTKNLHSLFSLWTDKIIQVNLCKILRNLSQKE